MALHYKTRGMSEPKGKPRVYFCCHPEDHGCWFDHISEQILKTHNCALWYADAAGAEPADLEQMQLFVMPVTRRLLTTDNRAMAMEFPLAIAGHIPVLPLMMESGLDGLFNEKCGDLQFLDPNAEDETTLSYNDKLKLFLDSVLIGDELAERVRAAFDAYVFLSYRKKDRKYAQELMRLIHRNELCRDLAIWYDEFLIPGENFSDAIRDALKKSGLFVLAVTPNLVNELNYVMTTEYPMAVREGKTVLPAEMEKTDRAALEEKYEDIPPCTDPRNESDLSRALLDALRSLALRGNDSDPEHNYFIGLAYLGGIAVEVDHERALELITGAAKAELTEAMDKLTDMYRTGMGVSRDYMTAIHWQEEKVRLLKERFQKTKTSDDLYALARASLYCAELWKEQGEEDKEYRFVYIADKALKDWFWIGEAKTIPEKLSRKLRKPNQREPRLLGLLARCYKWYGQRYDSEVDSAAARRLDEELLEQAPAPEVFRELLIDYDQMGYLKLEQGKYEAAREWYDKALTLARRAVDIFGTVEARRQYAASCGSLVKWCKRREDWDGMERWNREYCDIVTALQKEADEPRLRRMLSNAIFCSGEICEGRGNYSGARSRYEESMAMDEALLAETGLFQDKKRVATDCYYLGYLCELEEDPDGARSWYERAYAIDDELAKATDNEEIIISRCEDAYRLGELYRKRGELDVAAEWYQKVWSSACRVRGGVRMGRQAALYKARSCWGEAEIHYRRENWDALDSALDNAARFYFEVRESGRECDVREFVEYEIWHSTHNGCFLTLTPCLESALEVALPLAQRTGKACDRRNLSDIYERFARDSLNRKEFDKARHWVEKLYALCKPLAEETGETYDRQGLAVACGLSGDVEYELGAHDSAREWYKQALQNSRALRRQEENPQILEYVAWYCRKVAKLTPKSRARYLREAEGIYEQLCRDFPEDKEYRDLLRDTHLEG